MTELRASVFSEPVLVVVTRRFVIGRNAYAVGQTWPSSEFGRELARLLAHCFVIARDGSN